jgi:alpha-D-ribose 1-methylphosphonate 5-triphosphate diphosphatase
MAGGNQGSLRMACEQILTGGRIVAPEGLINGTVLVRDGRIAAIDDGSSRLASAVDLDGDYLLPGLVDIHTDNLERHLEPRPGVAWPHIAALITHDRQIAAAGITTVLDSLCIGSVDQRGAGRSQTLAGSLQALQQAQADGLLKVDHRLHLRCEVSTPGVVEAFAPFVDDPLVRLVSLMDHTPGQRQWRHLDKWRRLAGRGTELADDGEAALLQRRRLDQAIYAAPTRAAIVALCQQRGVTLASHDDTTAEHVAEAVADGVAISEFPTTLEAAQAARDSRLSVVMGAPNVVLGASHSGNVSARALGGLGLVDGLASDYVPISLIQACFIFHWHLAMPLPDAVATVAAAPAAMVGLTDRGMLAAGQRADLIRVHAYRQMPVVRTVWRGGEMVA